MGHVSWKCLLVIATSLFWAAQMQGQITDCIGAQIICSDGPVTFAPNGQGRDDFANPNNQPGCLLSLEAQSAWYYFEFREDMPPNSVLEFTIAPFLRPGQKNPDFDFAIFGPDRKCDSLGAPLRCSFAIDTCTFCPLTGLGKGAIDTSEGAWNTDGFVAPMVVQPGQGFYLLLDNFKADATGFTLTWGGSAAPFLNCLANPICRGKAVDAGDDMQFCQSPTPTSFKLNATAKDVTNRVKYEWQGTPQALALLNDKTILQPTVTLPPNFNGSLDFILSITDGDCVTADAVTVTVTPNPPAQLRADTVICPGESSTISLGSPYQSYLWSNGATTPTIVVNTPGTYAVTVSNGGVCSSTDTITIVRTNVTQPTIEGGNSLCNGESLTLRTNTPFSSYAWSNAQTTPSISVNRGGNYSVTVTDANGCRATGSLQVTEFPKPTPQITGTTSFCEGQTTTLATNSAYNGYQWSSGETTPSIISNAAGMVSVTVTDANQCTGSASITLTSSLPPTLAVTGTALFCANSSTQLTATTNAAQIRWSNGATTPSITVSTAGNYMVTVSNSNGCQRSDTVQVREQPRPQPVIANRITICPENSATLEPIGTFAAYQWSNGATTPSIKVSQPGNYTLQVTDSVGCVGNASTTVEIFPVIARPTISGTTNFCPDSGTVLTAAGNFVKYTWSNGDSTNSTRVFANGTYTVTAQDANGCSSQDSIRVQAFLVSAPVPDTVAFCAGAFATFNAGANYRAYQWSNGSTQPAIQVSNNGIYTVTVTDENGCQSTARYTAQQNTPPAVSVSGNLRFCAGSSTQLSASTGFQLYQWSNNATTPSITVQNSGTYRLTVTDSNGCSDTTSVIVTAQPLPTPGIVGTNQLCTDASTTLSVNNSFPKYLWSNGSQQREVTITQGGTYQVTVTDQNNCEGVATIVVTAFAKPTVTITADTLICTGASARLTATPGFRTYRWSNGSTLDTTQVNQAGNYTVTVTDANGCQTSDTVRIAQLNVPLPNAGQNQTLDCNNRSAQLNASVLPGGPYRFVWNGPGINTANQNSQQPTVSQSGTYELILIDTISRCSSAAVQVQVVEAAYTPTIVLQLQDTLDCNTASVSINATGSQQGNSLTYQWLDAQRTPLPNGQGLRISTTQAGWYYFTVQDTRTGCNALDSIEVMADFDPAFVEAGMPQTLDCNNTRVTLQGETSSIEDHILYRWTSPTGNRISNQLTTTVDQPGWYILTITNAKNGCSNRDSVEVRLDRTPPVISAGTDQSLDCNTKSAMLQAIADNNADSIIYSWTAPPDFTFADASRLTQEVNQPGLYILQAENRRNGCIARDSVTVVDDANYPTAVTIEVVNPTCFGLNNGQIQIKNISGGTGPYLAGLNGTSLQSVTAFPNLGAGTYELTVEDVAGCAYQTEVTLQDQLQLKVTLGPDTTIRLGDILKLEPFVNIPTQKITKINWIGPDKFGECEEECWVQPVSPKISTDYVVKVISEQGCEALDTINVEVLKSRAVYVPTGFTPNGDGFNDVFVVYAGREVVQVKYLRIMDRWGNQVFQAKDFRPNDPSRGWDGNIPGAKDPTPAVFAWLAEIEFIDGTSQLFKGDLTLIR